jgi:hypothetical protein
MYDSPSHQLVRAAKAQALAMKVPIADAKPISRWELLPTRAPVEEAKPSVVAGQVWRWDYPGVNNVFDGTEWVVLGPAGALGSWRMSLIDDDSQLGIMLSNERVGHWTFVRDRR